MAIKKNKMWNRFRHRVAFAILQPIFALTLYFRYRYRCKNFKIKKKEPCIILSSHVLMLDPFLVSRSFHRPVYYIANDDLFMLPVSPIIEYLVAPIAKTKSNSDVRTIMDCGKVLKGGGAVGIFPEGNCSYWGEFASMTDAIAKMVKLFKVPVIFYKITGGYGAEPRWAKKPRRGRVRGEVGRVVQPQEFKDMPENELLELIKHELNYNDVEKCNSLGITFKSKKRAEYLERVLYYCPICGKTETLKSHNEKVKCENCGFEAEYTESLHIKPLNNKLPFDTVKGWMDCQAQYVKNYDYESIDNKTVLFHDDSVTNKFYTKGDKRKKIGETGTLIAYKDRLEFCGQTFMYADILNMAAFEKNKLLFYVGDNVYQFYPPKRTNVVKYLNLYYAVKNKMEGKNSEFMGL